MKKYTSLKGTRRDAFASSEEFWQALLFINKASHFHNSKSKYPLQARKPDTGRFSLLAVQHSYLHLAYRQLRVLLALRLWVSSQHMRSQRSSYRSFQRHGHHLPGIRLGTSALLALLLELMRGISRRGSGSASIHGYSPERVEGNMHHASQHKTAQQQDSTGRNLLAHWHVSTRPGYTLATRCRCTAKAAR